MTWGQGVTEFDNMQMFNGTSWEPYYNNLVGTLLPQGAYTAAQAFPTLVNPNHTKLRVYLNVVTPSASGSLTLSILGIEPTTNTLTQALLTAAAIAGGAAAGLRVYELTPSAATSDGATQSAIGFLPRKWTVAVAHGDGSSWTYAVSYSLLI